MINITQARAVIERGVIMLAAYLVGKGWLPQAIQPEFVGAVMALASLAWGYWNNRSSALVAKADAQAVG